jgi:hypothetical protein
VRPVVLAVLFVAGLSFGASAQEMPQASESVVAPAAPNPAAIMPPAPPKPQVQTPAAGEQSSVLSNVFPELPPSEPCKPGDLWGYYRLEKLYEQPAGKESADYQTAPLQFIHFSADSTFRPLKLAQRINNRRAFYDRFTRKEDDPMLQYTVHEGFVYFYNEGRPIDTQACFIVANDFGEFKKGRLILMPPAPQEGEQITSRLLRVYHNFNRPRGRPPHAKAAKP